MSSVVIAGDTSGSITLQAPAVAGTTTHSLPATSGTILNDATCGVCRAWVNFNGTGTVAIRASFNVSSITDNGVGDYTVNFTNALSDANYAASAGIGQGTGGALGSGGVFAFAAPTTTAIRMQTVNAAGSGTVDPAYVTITVHR